MQQLEKAKKDWQQHHQQVQGLLKELKDQLRKGHEGILQQLENVKKKKRPEQLNKDHEETLQQDHQELQQQVQVLKQQIKGRNTYLEQLKKTS